MEFIIYEKNKALLEIYKKVIFHVMNSSNYNYSYTIYSTYDEALDKEIFNHKNNRIYIINMDIIDIDLAMYIRRSGDLISPIITITKRELKMVGFTGKTYMLDCITNNKCIEDNLTEMIEASLNVIKTGKSISFCYKGESFLIPYSDVLYIEKVLNDNSSLIVTDNGSIVIPKSICTLEQELDGGVFIKTHRSCLVNIYKVRHINYDKGIMIIGNKEIGLLSRSNKKLVRSIFENIRKKREA